MDNLVTFRRALHAVPEVSGAEIETAKTLAAAFGRLAGADVRTGLGGHGVACVLDSGAEGPTVLLRAELDALPIHEISGNAWRSTFDGVGHLCGHDGHMTLLFGVGQRLAAKPVARGRVVLMAQPAEEDGSGARAVVADRAFEALKPDWAFAIHNEPGRPYGHVSTRAGLMNCASRGLALTFTGKTAHAADPGDGVSPARAIAALIARLEALGPDGPLDAEFRLVTICHLRMGEATFGIAPGEAVVHVTLRATRDDNLDALEDTARDIAARLADEHGLALAIDVQDAFAATVNDADATEIARRAMDAIGVPHDDDNLPMRASEDFGVFGRDAKAAMLCLGAGENHAALHNPDYDFPDGLLPIGVAIFERIVRDLLD